MIEKILDDKSIFIFLRIYSQASSFQIPVSICLLVGIIPFINWLQQFGENLTRQSYQSQSSFSSISSDHCELEVSDVATLIAELSQELGIIGVSDQNAKFDKFLFVNELGETLSPGKVLSTEAKEAIDEKRKEGLLNLIHTCILLRLLGGGTESGKLKISDLRSLIEDVWFRTLPKGSNIINTLSVIRVQHLVNVIINYFSL